MKTKTITTSSCTLLVCELDKFTDVDCPIEIHGNKLVSSQSKGLVINTTKLPEGNWQLLGRLPEITEDQAGKIVDSVAYDESRTLYSNYVNKRWTAFALNSIFSLLQANEVYFENPIVIIDGTIKENNITWLKAQGKVWDKERTYLFIKVD